jgi:hypothetical protein
MVTRCRKGSSICTAQQFRALQLKSNRAAGELQGCNASPTCNYGSREGCRLSVEVDNGA